MQAISNSLPQSTAGLTDVAVPRKVDTAADDTQGSDQAAAKPLTQDDAVKISAEGQAAARQEIGKDVEVPRAYHSTGKPAPGAAGADGAQGADGDPSTVKSFAYGALGLERPDKPKEDTNDGYTAGRWLAAGFTIAGIIALLA